MSGSAHRGKRALTEMQPPQESIITPNEPEALDHYECQYCHTTTTTQYYEIAQVRSKVVRYWRYCSLKHMQLDITTER